MDGLHNLGQGQRARSQASNALSSRHEGKARRYPIMPGRAKDRAAADGWGVVVRASGSSHGCVAGTGSFAICVKAWAIHRPSRADGDIIWQRPQRGRVGPGDQHRPAEM